MVGRLLAIVLCAGCAQLAGLDETTGRDAGADARLDGTVRNDASTDATPLCVGGDVGMTDPVSGACYTFHMTPQTRANARVTCQGLGIGVRMASVQSVAENDLITALIGTNSAFLGGGDEVTEGVYLWDDGTSISLTNWNTMEPNNAAGMGEEDCIVIHGSLAGKWDDRPCAPSALPVPGEYPVVCERK